MANVPITEDISKRELNRKVWVINHSPDPHVETFRGETVKIDGNSKILMPVLAANRFLSQGFQMEEVLPNGTVLWRGKSLEIREMTDEERANAEGTSVKTLQAQRDQLKSVKVCAICGEAQSSEHGLKIHMGRAHKGETGEEASPA